MHIEREDERSRSLLVINSCNAREDAALSNRDAGFKAQRCEVILHQHAYRDNGKQYHHDVGGHIEDAFQSFA